jgi:hypothetical protein
MTIPFTDHNASYKSAYALQRFRQGDVGGYPNTFLKRLPLDLFVLCVGEAHIKLQDIIKNVSTKRPSDTHKRLC